MHRSMLTTGIVLALTLGFVWVTQRDGVAALRWPPLLWLGAISYPLYLLHQNIGHVFAMKLPDAWGPWPLLLAAAFVTLLAWLVYRLVQVRLSRWLHGVLLRRTTR